MILDAEERGDDWFTDRIFDVCIVGGGPAGITVARQLAQAGWAVGLFEGGGLEYSHTSQELYEGSVIGQEYYDLTATRLRYLGGTSGHWAGWCYELEDIDFRSIDGRPHSGWPISSADLYPYRDQTKAVLDIDDPGQPPHYLDERSSEFRAFSYRNSPPTRFGEKYREELDSSKSIEVYLHANLVDIELAPSLGAVHRLTFRSFARPESFHIRARYYVLCLGGLENPRALLNANDQISTGIGNERDNVGRFFAEHPHAQVAEALLEEVPDDVLYFKPSEAFMLEERIGNLSMHINPTGVPSLPEGGFRETVRSLVCTTSFKRRLFEAVRGRDLECVDGTAEISAISEQMPNPDSRVTLGGDTDRFGLRQIHLDWQLTEKDLHTLRAATLRFGALMAEQRLGRIRPSKWLMEANSPNDLSISEIQGGNHHMCTTRMGTDPSSSVVDASCKVHSVDNLYIGGSSVFSTAGWANPTFTIVQLAFRLADHLNNRLKTS